MKKKAYFLFIYSYVCSFSFMCFLIIRWNTEFFWMQFNINFDFKLFHVPKFYYLLTDIICSCDGFWYLIKLFVNESNISRSHHRAAIVCSFDRFLTSIFRKQPQRIFLWIWTLLGGIHWVGICRVGIC